MGDFHRFFIVVGGSRAEKEEMFSIEFFDQFHITVDFLGNIFGRCCSYNVANAFAVNGERVICGYNSLKISNNFNSTFISKKLTYRRKI